LSASLAGAALLGAAATSSAQPVVRDHRRGPRPDEGPREAPPALRAEQHEAARAGFVWINGQWDWRGGRWEWVSGHWERERARQQWVEGSWQQRNGRWEWVEGGWQNYPEFPTAPPPPPQPENPGFRPGFVWMPGAYRWTDGRYTWT